MRDGLGRTASLVAMPRTISTSGMTGTGFMKCMPTCVALTQSVKGVVSSQAHPGSASSPPCVPERVCAFPRVLTEPWKCTWACIIHTTVYQHTACMLCQAACTLTNPEQSQHPYLV